MKRSARQLCKAFRGSLTLSGTVVVSQLGARMHYAVPRIFARAGELECLYTDICAVKGWPKLLDKLPRTVLPSSLRRLAGRVPKGISKEKIHSFDGFGLASGVRRTFASPLNETNTTLAVARGFSRAVLKQGFGAAEGFYGISGECLEQMREARRKGLWTVVEQIIAPRQVLDRLLAVEQQRHPHWQPDAAQDRWAEDYALREKAEWAAASVIVCPSEFVRRTIGEVGGPVERCVVVPYGIDLGFQVARPARRQPGPLRVLTIGQVGLRKGAPYVLEAARRLAGTATFRMVGPVAISQARQQEMHAALDLAGPTPRSEILEHYKWADVFFLPSVCEGSATVTYEALAAGLPVVTTPNAGSVIRNGVDGFICPAGNHGAFRQALEQLALDPQLLASMSKEAAITGRDHDVSGYGRRLLGALQPMRDAWKSAGRELLPQS